MRNINGLLDQKSTFLKYLSLQEHELSSYHFSSIFLWQDFFDFDFELINQSLCIFAHNQGSCFQYLAPLAEEFDQAVIEASFKKMNAINPRTARIENIAERDLKFFDTYKSYEKCAEYVYDKQALVSLKGHAYKSHRHDIHHFQRHHQGVFRPYEMEDYRGCMALFEQWAQNRYDKHEDLIYRTMLQENQKVHELALLYHKPLDLVGFVVEINQKIAAYSFGYVLNLQTFCVLLEITDPHVNGLSAFIFNCFCSSEALRQCKLINTMDDFGLPFISSSKEAYHPQFKPVSFTISKS